jgi:UDP-GlcNAc:undecaprenyl-phosphate GlcNAc-1-phosphate transferase
LLGLGLATALVFWGTPVAIRVAARLNFYDRPMGYKGHAAPTPYLGGAPVMLAFVAVLAILTSDWQRTLPVAGGVIALWGLGTLDDKRSVSPLVRVLAESLLAAVLYAAGDGWQLGGGDAIGLIVTIVWVVAVVNALNLFDNMDGAASSIALVISAGVAVTGAVQGDVWLSVAAAGLCGACLGFLPHNLARPARIFLGDGGSMPLGFALAALVMLAAGNSGPAWQALAMGLLLVGVPALDTCLVIVSRTRRGVSILTAGQDHLTHRTFQRLRTTRAVAFALGSVQALLATLALLASRQSSELLVVIVLLYLVGAAIAIVAFDRRGHVQYLSGSLATAGAPVAGSPTVAAPAEPATAARTRSLDLELVVLAVLGAGAGVSPFFGGFYDQTIWAPIGLGLLVLLTAVVIARPVQLRRAATIALCALGALGALALVSAAWAGSPTNASVNGNRYVVYALFLALVLVLVRGRREAVVLIGSFCAAALAVAGADLVRMLSGDLEQLFVNGRLNGPLGYINGQANFFLLAAWPCVALAEQRRLRWLSGLALAASTLLFGLTVMSQSRGAILALIASVVIVLAAVPGRRRRAAGLALVAAAVAATVPTLLDAYHSTNLSRGVSAPAAHDAAVALLLASAVVGLVWWAALAIEAQLRARSQYLFEGARTAVSAAYATAAVVAVGAAILTAGTLGHSIRTQYDAFVHLDPAATSDSSVGRLVSGGGHRYDYWRVAADTWEEKPLGGVGGGNYPRSYYLKRQTSEAILQPHSIELQTLSELGLPGAALLLVLLCAVIAGIVFTRRRALVSTAERGLLVAATGTIAAWSVHTSVDWMHLLPGVTAGALIAVAVLLRSPEERKPGVAPAAVAAPARLEWWRRPALVSVTAIVLALAATSLTRQGLADRFRAEAQDSLASSPRSAIDWANRSLRLDGDAPATYYVKAAALARFGAARPAELVLRQAIRREPGNFLSYALLGDLYTREKRFGLASEAYRTALAQNPREPDLISLAHKHDSRLARKGSIGLP